MINSIINKLFKAEDGSSLALFRIAFGCIMTWEVCRYYSHGWIERYWIKPDFFFNYGYFEWLSPLPDNLMYVHFFFLGMLAVFIALGLFYRISTVLFFLGFTYIFLLDKATYLNHFYLISLLSFILIWLPAHKKYSIDAKLFPSISSKFVPYWAILALQLQIGVAYFYGGIAKLNSDWLSGEPMRDWILDAVDFPIVGQYFTHPAAAYLFSYGGLMLDLFIVPFLFWRKTRIPAFIVICSFHLTNANLFSIGIFPWFMIAATTIYFSPDWFSKCLSYIRKNKAAVGNYVDHNITAYPIHKPLLYGFAIYFAIQFLYPLRHHAIPGNASWTEEGHRYAWHMKLRQKGAKLSYTIVDNNNQETQKINPAKYLSKRQFRKMKNRPDMILQFAHYIAKRANPKGDKDISVYANSKARLNNRPYQVMIDPKADLAKRKYQVYKNDWILPLTTPLHKPNTNLTENLFLK